MRLELRPLGVRAACAEVARLHRHLPRIVGGLVGVASQPKARLSRDGFTVEITRVATDGHRNACSKLYGALMRASAAVGYRKAITFTRLDEPGTSLRAAGFADDGLTRDQSWSRPSRGRGEHTSQVRRWVRAIGVAA